MIQHGIIWGKWSDVTHSLLIIRQDCWALTWSITHKLFIIGQDVKVMLIESYSLTVNHFRYSCFLQQRHGDNSHVHHQHVSSIVNQAFTQRNWNATSLHPVAHFEIYHFIYNHVRNLHFCQPVPNPLSCICVTIDTIDILTQKCGNLTKTAIMTSSQSNLETKTCLNKVNA